MLYNFMKYCKNSINSLMIKIPQKKKYINLKLEES